MSDTTEIHSLVARVSDGDRQAFLRLYDHFSGRVYGLALHMLRDHMAAEEVTQDTFLKVWTRADTFQPARGRFITWLLSIARRTALDRIRRDSRRPPTAEYDMEEDPWLQLPEPDSMSEEARWRTVSLALDELPAEQRQVISFAFYYGLSQRQIAEELDLPLGTVKTRIRLGMDKLRQSLGRDSGSGPGT